MYYQANAVDVALRKESVDRNTNFSPASLFGLPVALRKESVDRNLVFARQVCLTCRVALRKESVDRNTSFRPASLFDLRRSPQGERG